MKHLIFCLLLFIALARNASAQRYYDSLKKALSFSGDDTNRVMVLYLLATYYESTDPDSTHFYAKQTEDLSETLRFPKGKFLAQDALIFPTVYRANYVQALAFAINNFTNAKAIPDESDRDYYLAVANERFGHIKRLMKDTVGNAAISARQSQLVQKS